MEDMTVLLCREAQPLDDGNANIALPGAHIKRPASLLAYR
jgi:hypothetical protein